MASSLPTKQEADQIIKAKKIITASVSWVAFIDGGWRLDAKALDLENKVVLNLKGRIGKTNHSFSLLYKNYSIRRYTKHDRHIFKGQVFTEPHKHKWSEKYLDKEVYIPEDINPDDNVNDQFISFCRECNIELRGGYQRVAYEFRK